MSDIIDKIKDQHAMKRMEIIGGIAGIIGTLRSMEGDGNYPGKPIINRWIATLQAQSDYVSELEQRLSDAGHVLRAAFGDDTGGLLAKLVAAEAALAEAIRDQQASAAMAEGANKLREALAAGPDWWWCDIDPDECGYSAYDAMFQHRARLTPVELSTSYVGPRFWGVMAPPLPDAEDDGDTAHTFETKEEAEAFIADYRARAAIAEPSDG